MIRSLHQVRVHGVLHTAFLINQSGELIKRACFTSHSPAQILLQLSCMSETVGSFPLSWEPVPEVRRLEGNSGEVTAQLLTPGGRVVAGPRHLQCFTVAKEPVAKEPVAKEPVAKEPVAKEPVAKEPVAKEPVAKEPVASLLYSWALGK